MRQAQIVAQSVLKNLGAGQLASAAVLTPAIALTMKNALELDSKNEAYSGALSIVDAIQNINNGLYSWATVKLYYATFYLLRASLGLAHYAIIYHNGKPYSWNATPGSYPHKINATTHKAVLNSYRAFCPNSILLSQQISLESPLDWL